MKVRLAKKIVLLRIRYWINKWYFNHDARYDKALHIYTRKARRKAQLSKKELTCSTCKWVRYAETNNDVFINCSLKKHCFYKSKWEVRKG